MTRIARLSVDINHLRGHVELDLGPGAGAAAHGQARTELLRTLAHADHAPMAGDTVLYRLAGNSLAIVADAHAHVRGVVLDFGIDPLGSGMPECIRQRLSGDQENLLGADGMQVAAGSPFRELERRGMRNGEIRGDILERGE